MFYRLHPGRRTKTCRNFNLETYLRIVHQVCAGTVLLKRFLTIPAKDVLTRIRIASTSTLSFSRSARSRCTLLRLKPGDRLVCASGRRKKSWVTSYGRLALYPPRSLVVSSQLSLASHGGGVTYSENEELDSALAQ